MASPLKKWVETYYPVSKHDLMTAFMERAATLSIAGGYWGMINLPAWMFLDAYAKMRGMLLKQQSFESLIHLGRGIFGADFGSTAFVMQNTPCEQRTRPRFFRTYSNHVDVRSPDAIEQIFRSRSYDAFSLLQDDLRSIPGTPIAYWINDAVRRAFRNAAMVSESFDLKDRHHRRQTTPNLSGAGPRWLRTGFSKVAQDPRMNCRWFPLYKGGERRKWYGNLSNVVDYSGEGNALELTENAMLTEPELLFSPRHPLESAQQRVFRRQSLEQGCIFEDLSPSLFGPSACEVALPLLNAKTTRYFIRMFSSGRKTEIGHVGSVPLPHDYDRERTSANANRLVALGRSDWDGSETLADLHHAPTALARPPGRDARGTYAHLREHWRGMTEEMQRLEEENNRIFIDAYGLQDELTPEVPIEEITLTCNPAYRYGGEGQKPSCEARLLADTMGEFLSYAVGCMFGRYSLDAPGLILANQGETWRNTRAKVPKPTFDA